MPGRKGFGMEEHKYNARLNVDNGYYVFKGEIESKVGNWNLLFNHIASVILDNKPYLIEKSHILDQINILSSVKSKANV